LVGIDGLPTINLELWDIPGALDPNLEDIYFKDADGVVMVFDVADAKRTTEELSGWFDRLKAFEDRHNLKPLPKIKFGNKRDLIHGVLWHHYDSSKVRLRLRCRRHNLWSSNLVIVVTLQAPPRKDRELKFANFLTCPSFTVSAKDFGGVHSAFKQVIAEVYNNKHPLPTEGEGFDVEVETKSDVPDGNLDNVAKESSPSSKLESKSRSVEAKSNIAETKQRPPRSE